MQEHIHLAKRSRIISQSFIIWIFVGLQIGLNIFAISKDLTTDRIFALVFINVILGMLSVPGVFLFMKYYKHSVGKKFIITFDSLKFIDENTGETNEIKSSEIKRINLVVNRKMSKLPWLFHEYFSFIDDKQNKIIITSYIMNITDFWIDSLTRKVSSDKLVKEEKTYPIM